MSWQVKNLLPKSLFGRNVLLFVVLIVVVQMTMLVAFYQVVQKPRSEQLAVVAAVHIGVLKTALTSLTPEQRITYLNDINAKSVMQVALTSPEEIAATSATAPVNPLVQSFLVEMRKQMPPATKVVWVTGGKPELWVSFQVDQSAYWFKVSGERFTREFSNISILLTGIYGVLAFVAAYLLQRRLNQPLRQLVRAATQIGQGNVSEPLPEDAPSEIAAVSRSFNQMAHNLRRMDEERAVMLAGVSHDLRTPLTKLQLGVAMLSAEHDDDLKQGMARHINEINTIIEQFVDFARIGSDEELSHFDLNEMLMNLVGDFAAQQVHFEVDLVPLPAVHMRPIAIYRMLNNLMRNAAYYGKQGLAVKTRLNGEQLRISILDRGPGIPAHETERVKQAFTRLDEGRSAVSGSGLGLAITERIARLHGGELQLLPRFEGGLEAVVCLPLRGMDLGTFDNP